MNSETERKIQKQIRRGRKGNLASRSWIKRNPNRTQPKRETERIKEGEGRIPNPNPRSKPYSHPLFRKREEQSKSKRTRGRREGLPPRRRKKMNSETLTLTSYPNRLNPKRETRFKKEKGKGEETNLAARRMSLRRRGRRRPSREVFRRARPRGRRGQAARRRRAHPLGNAPAGEGGGDGAGALCSTISPARRLVAAAQR
jgi:hypothetical protein